MKKFKNIIITIVLGAFGSAFWELFFKPFLVWLYEKAIPHLLLLSSDSFYSKIPTVLETQVHQVYMYFLYVVAIFFSFSSILCVTRAV